jgi:hypothetical protein
LPPASLLRCQLLSPNLEESRYARRVDFETISDQVVVGTQVLQTQADPIGPW